MKPLVAVVSLSLVLGGCSAFGKHRPADGPVLVAPELHDARAALVEGRTVEAEAGLERAMRDLSGYDRELAVLLMAEVRLQQERPDLALALARGVLEDAQDDPAAHEIAGKALLKLGEFDAADEHFATAESAPGLSESHRKRLEDLSALARGLAAYASADPEVARNYWNTIEHPKLRFEVDQSVREETQMAVARKPHSP